MKLMPIFYLPPLSWWKEFLSDNKTIILEQNENFPKQTYRNRANIFGANGKLSLSIPIKHNGNRALKEIQISNAENWRSLHWKSIKIAYQTSPYFEFYEKQLAKIYSFESDFLLDFNLNAIEILQKILKTEQAFQLSENYQYPFMGEDFRSAFSAKKESDYQMDSYYQTFSDKLGFIKDLSIVDLICNKGPESTTYIKHIKL